MPTTPSFGPSHAPSKTRWFRVPHESAATHSSSHASEEFYHRFLVSNSIDIPRLYVPSVIERQIRHEVWPNFGAEPDESNTTLLMIDRFLRTRKIESQYMEPDEMAYLAEHIEYANLFFRNDEHHSMTAIFKKKAAE